MNAVANVWIWIGFSIFLIIALGLDSYFINRKNGQSHVSMRTAVRWTLIWVASAFIFNLLLWLYVYRSINLTTANEVGLAFFTGYLIEKSLSVDNLFAFYMIFKQFKIPTVYQPRIFSYGIWSAVILRLGLIWFGIALITRFHWMFYIMGAFLLVTGIKMMFATDDKKELVESTTFKLLNKCFRLTSEHGNHFFIKQSGLWYATPLFIALIFIELSDLVFALDSIPAIFAITIDPFIVWSSNIFAILGLRALYFLLAKSVEEFQFLKYGIALILTFIGFKMLIEPWLHVSVGFSLTMVIGILLIFIILSVWQQKRELKRIK